jgi:hypothetical protein
VARRRAHGKDAASRETESRGPRLHAQLWGHRELLLLSVRGNTAGGADVSPRSRIEYGRHFFRSGGGVLSVSRRPPSCAILPSRLGNVHRPRELYVTGIEEIGWGVGLVAITMVLHGIGMVWTLRAVNTLKARLGPELGLGASLRGDKTLTLRLVNLPLAGDVGLLSRPNPQRAFRGNC